MMTKDLETEIRNRISILSTRWLEIKGYEAAAWNKSISIYLYADDCLIDIEHVHIDPQQTGTPYMRTLN